MFLDLLLKQSENATGRVAGLELGSEWVRQEVLLCASLIFFQSVIKNWFEGRRRCSSRLSVGHDSEEDCG